MSVENGSGPTIMPGTVTRRSASVAMTAITPTASAAGSCFTTTKPTMTGMTRTRKNRSAMPAIPGPPATGPIQDYCYKPEPIFYGDGPRFFGVELEIDGAGEYGSNAKKLLRIANEEEERIYCKHDGSLEEGFEIVTHPMSLSYQLQQIPWEQICKGAVDLGYTSHQAGTCGLHVHVSRLAFGETEEQQDTAIARVLYFFEKHWEELLKFSRRTQHQLDQWASRYGYKEQPMEILDHAKKGYHGGRYTCVNLTNRDTIEFRMFRGTLKYNTLIATLQLVDRICDVADLSV